MIISDDKLVNSTAKINNQEVIATKKIENSIEMIKIIHLPYWFSLLCLIFGFNV